jgi:FeS assembly SUF system protein
MDDAGYIPDAAAPAESSALSQEELDRLTEQLIQMFKTVFDPEIPVDIFELGLIYAVEIADDGKVKVEMTLTTPSCPSAQELPAQVEEAVRMVPGVSDVEVEVVWDPPWDQSRMSEDARLALNMF